MLHGGRAAGAAGDQADSNWAAKKDSQRMARTTRKPTPPAVTAAIQQLEVLAMAGVAQLPKSRRRAVIPAATTEAIAQATEPVTLAPAAPSTAPAASSVADSLEQIRREVSACQACSELCTTRTQTVFGVGNPHARLVFCGEAPGADEDRQGEPFVGRAGQLLTKIIEACTLKREDVYILNVLKCRPPGNRNPAPHEVANCRDFLDRQLALIRPEYICCLGTIAAQTLLETDTPISRLRGKFQEYRGIPVLCTYHPAYLLRNPAAKKDVWEDMKLLMRTMGIELNP